MRSYTFKHTLLYTHPYTCILTLTYAFIQTFYHTHTHPAHSPTQSHILCMKLSQKERKQKGEKEFKMKKKVVVSSIWNRVCRWIRQKRILVWNKSCLIAFLSIDLVFYNRDHLRGKLQYFNPKILLKFNEKEGVQCWERERVCVCVGERERESWSSNEWEQVLNAFSVFQWWGLVGIKPVSSLGLTSNIYCAQR